MKPFQLFYLVMGLIFLGSCGKKNEEVRPEIRDITETVFASGELDADNRYNLIAQTEGYISDFFMDEGDTLSIGDRVAYVDNTSFQANEMATREQYAIAQYNLSENAPAIKEATQNLELARVKLAQDQKNYERYKVLLEKNSVSRLDFENAELQYKQSQTNLVNAEQKKEQVEQQAQLNEIALRSQREIAATNKGFNTISALDRGVLVKRLKQKGDFVRKGDVVAIVADLSTIKAFLNVDENSVGKIAIGQEVDIRLNTLRDRLYKATLTEVSPMFDEASQSFICEAIFKDNLSFDIIGTQLEANIIIGTKKDVLLIPREYLSFSNAVQLKSEDEPRVIRTGIKSSKWVEVLDGLTADDVLIPLKK